MLWANIEGEPQVLGGISGTVTDSSGATVPSAKVIAINKATGEQRTTTTSYDGNFTVSGLPVGQYKVRVERVGFKIVEAEATVEVSKASHLNIILFLGTAESSASLMKIKVTDSHGAAIQGAAITVLDNNGATIDSGLTDQNGSFECTSGGGDYTVKAQSGTERHSEKRVRIKGGQTKQVKLRLQ